MALPSPRDEPKRGYWQGELLPMPAPTATTRCPQELHAQLEQAVDGEPVDDCLYHPAETIIGEWLKDLEPVVLLNWFRHAIVDSAASAHFASSVLRCVARLEQPGSGILASRANPRGVGVAQRRNQGRRRASIGGMGRHACKENSVVVHFEG